MLIHPLAKRYCSNEEYNQLNRLVDSKNNISNIEIDISIDEKELQREIKKIEETVKRSLDKAFK